MSRWSRRAGSAAQSADREGRRTAGSWLPGWRPRTDACAASAAGMPRRLQHRDAAPPRKWTRGADQARLPWIPLPRPRRCLFLRAREPTAVASPMNKGFGWGEAAAVVRAGGKGEPRTRARGREGRAGRRGGRWTGGSTDASAGQGRTSWASCSAAVPRTRARGVGLARDRLA